jgi:hypothetical protein
VSADLDAMAEDELARAMTLTWRQLAKVTPWGDSFEGVTEGGREVIVERAYLWQGEAGADILVEIEVREGVDGGAYRSAVIQREAA